MNSENEAVEIQHFVDFQKIVYSPAFAAGCFGLTTRRLKDIEEEHGVNIQRVARGSVPSRAYTITDIFEISALRRALNQAKGFKIAKLLCQLLFQKAAPQKQRRL